MKFKSALFILLCLPLMAQAKALTQAEFDLALAKLGFLTSEINKTSALAKQKDNTKAYLVTVCMKFDIMENALSLAQENTHLAEAVELEKQLTKKIEHESKIIETEQYSRKEFCDSTKRLYSKSIIDLYKD